MIHEIVDLTVEGSVGNPTLTTYIISKSDALEIKTRPLILICPGGGYEHVSEREGEMIALQYVSAGFHAAVVKYSVAPARYPIALNEVDKAVKYLKAKADEYGINADRIVIQGSSAGGHLAASYAIFNGGLGGMILSYPVITSGEFAHRGSFTQLLGERYDELVERMSLENADLSKVPPTFIWSTDEDATVPCENTLLFSEALRKHHIPFESHIYPVGRHGLGLGTMITSSVGDREVEPYVSGWMDLSIAFVNRIVGGF